MFSTPQVPQRLHPESQYVVTLDEKDIGCRRPSGATDSVTWDDLDAVIVETNDTGPLSIDVLWLVLGVHGSTDCVIPQGAIGEQA